MAFVPITIMKGHACAGGGRLGLDEIRSCLWMRFQGYAISCSISGMLAIFKQKHVMFL